MSQSGNSESLGYESLKPLPRVGKALPQPKHPKGLVMRTIYERKAFQSAFKPESKTR